VSYLFGLNAVTSFSSLAGALLLVLLLFPAIPAHAEPQETAFALPANAGFTGLFDMPSARVMKDWHMRFHLSRVGNYTTGALAASFLPRLEVNGRITDFSNIPGLSTDKALDFKLNLIKEGEAWPALSIGATDIHGTGLFASRYLVASKYIGPFDVTLGIGQGILAGEVTEGPGSGGSASEDAALDFLTSSLNRDTRFFGGVELRLTEDFSLLGEYSSLDYEKLENISEPARMPFNFGLAYRLDSAVFTLSFQQGRELSGSFSTQFPLQPEGLLPWKKKPYWSPTEELRQEAMTASNEELALLLRYHVAAEGFSNVRTSVADAAAWVEIENPTYLSDTQAMNRALRAISALAPPRIAWIYLSVKKRNIIFVTVKLGRADFEAYIDHRLDTATLLNFSVFNSEGNELRQAFARQEIGASPLTASYGSKKYAMHVWPQWTTFLNDLSGFWRQRFSLLTTVSYFPWPGGFVTGSLNAPLYNDIKSSIVTSEEFPIRSDSVDYLAKSDIRVDTLAFDQIVNLPDHWLGRAGLGLFESAYGGGALEVFRFFREGRFGLGLETEWVKKRDLDNDFTFRSDTPSLHTFFLNLYHKLLPEIGLDIGLKLGRFVAGDWGGRLDVSRTYRYFTMGAWYTITDTDLFTASFNKGYHDKGIYLTVPFSVFKDHDNPLRLFYSFRPWGRDTGQTVRQVNGLYPMARGLSIDRLKREFGSPY
jgi:hypothetical protein